MAQSVSQIMIIRVQWVEIMIIRVQWISQVVWVERRVIRFYELICYNYNADQAYKVL